MEWQGDGRNTIDLDFSCLGTFYWTARDNVRWCCCSSSIRERQGARTDDPVLLQLDTVVYLATDETISFFVRCRSRTWLGHRVAVASSILARARCCCCLEHAVIQHCSSTIDKRKLSLQVSRLCPFVDCLGRPSALPRNASQSCLLELRQQPVVFGRMLAFLV